MKKNVAQMSPDMQKQMAAVIQQTEDQQKKMASDPKMLAMMKQAFAEEEKSDQANYQERLARWEKDYPADVKQLVARRLRAFLDESAGVDFAARLVPKGNRQLFADARYEEKSSEWKLCYRAGREATEAARTFATSWLKEIGGR